MTWKKSLNYIKGNKENIAIADEIMSLIIKKIDGRGLNYDENF